MKYYYFFLEDEVKADTTWKSGETAKQVTKKNNKNKN